MDNARSMELSPVCRLADPKAGRAERRGPGCEISTRGAHSNTTSGARNLLSPQLSFALDGEATKLRQAWGKTRDAGNPLSYQQCVSNPAMLRALRNVKV